MPVSAIIPAYRAAAIVGETVKAARRIPQVSEVIVVDDGSNDGTGEAARLAGADVVMALPRNAGKGGALAAGVAAAHCDRVLFLDADLGGSAAEAGPLVEAVGEAAAMAIAVLPKRGGGGGFGLARGLAWASIRLLAGREVAAPLSGQRALPAQLVRHVGLAPRFGAETGLTVEVAHLNLPIVEIPLPLEHEPTGRTLSGFLHRGRQFRDVLRFALLAGYGLGWPALSPARTAVRMAAWLAALAAVIALAGVRLPSAAELVGITAGAGVAAWLPSLWVGAVWLRLRRPNYLGRSLPAGAGLLFLAVGLPALWFSPLARELRAPGLIVVGVLGAAGLLDDLLARRRQARGLRGHLGSLLRGRLTTGAVKAIAGLGAGLAAGAMLAPGRPAMIALDALLIALSANVVNLLDLRPSRALKGFGVMCAVAIAASPKSIDLLGPLLALAVVAAPAEFAGRVMLGDVGANVLGGAAGLGLAIALSPVARLMAVALLLAVHLVCERVSLTDVIAGNRVLAWLDRIGTAHLAPFPAPEAVKT